MKSGTEIKALKVIVNVATRDFEKDSQCKGTVVCNVAMHETWCRDERNTVCGNARDNV